MSNRKHYVNAFVALGLTATAVLVFVRAGIAQNMLQGNVQKAGEQTAIPSLAPDLLGRTKTQINLPHLDGNSEEPLTQIPAVDTSSKPIPVVEVGTKPQRNGVLGVFIGQYDGTVTQIFPGSDSNGKLRLGDKVIAVDGRHYGSVFETQRAFIGVPGSIVQVTIVRAGKEMNFAITRTDWRIYENQGLPYQFASPANVGIVRH